MSERLREAARVALEHGARVEVIGCWVWAWYSERPPAETREAMKAAKFKYNGKRKCWQFAGRPSKGSPEHTDGIRRKYGAFAVSADDFAEVMAE